METAMDKKVGIEVWEIRLNELHELVTNPVHGIQKNVNKLHDAVFGNGEGIKSQVKDIRIEIKDLKDFVKDTQNKNSEYIQMIQETIDRYMDLQKDLEIKKAEAEVERIKKEKELSLKRIEEKAESEKNKRTAKRWKLIGLIVSIGSLTIAGIATIAGII